MQKVYLLLRHNQQTGPFNLEELLQFDLKPYDLIWIEGKSAGWYYPQEIKALQPHLSFLKPAPAKPIANTTQPSVEKNFQPAQPQKIFVSMPSYTREELTPKPNFTTASHSQNETTKFSEPVQPKKQVEEVKTSYSKSMQDVETDYMNWMYQKKKTKKPVVSVKGAIAACLVIGVAIAAWWIMKPGEGLKIDSEEQSSFVPVQNELAADSILANESSTEYTKSASPKKQKQNNAVANKKPAGLVAKHTPPNQTETIVTTKTTESNEYEITPPVVKEESKPVVKKDEPVIAEAPKENKKLRDKIFDLFKKKPEAKKEEAKPVEEEDGRRNSTRRESGSSLVQMVTVKLSTPNDWMMGIKGAKATLTNRSSEAIVKAVVEVIYYNDDNDVVDRKTISFASIKSKQTQTVSIPDHATATRLEYNVVSVTGAGEPFAKM